MPAAAPGSHAIEKAFALLPAMLAGIGVTATPRQLALFRAHFELLLRWNSKMNLSAIRDPVEILRRHFLESAFLTRVLELGPGTLVDVGSGAGFPGLPVKVLSPETRVVLVEAVHKKAAFLKEVVRTLGLPGTQVLASRAELVDVKGDWVTIRAVKVTQTLLAVLTRLLVPRGTLALFTVERDARRTLGKSQGRNFGWNMSRIPGSRTLVVLVGRRST